MPSSLFGIPFYLAAAIFFLVLTLLIAWVRAVRRPRLARRDLGTPPPRSGGGGLQTLSAVLGILSFAMQILQWLEII